MDGFYRNTPVSSEMRACETKKVDNYILTLFWGYSIFWYLIFILLMFISSAQCVVTYLTIIIIHYFLVYIIFFSFTQTHHSSIFVQDNVDVDAVIVNYRMWWKVNLLSHLIYFFKRMVSILDVLHISFFSISIKDAQNFRWMGFPFFH